jgi:hypothetical protein
MRYWGILAAKLAAIWLLWKGAWMLILAVMPPPSAFLYHYFRPFGHDLKWTAVILLHFLFGCGLLYLAVLDQRFRCRSCGRRLRMPVLRGSYSKMLQEGRPKFEYICPFGHGTLSVPGTRFHGREPIDWRANKDLWEHLIAADRARGT